MALQKGGFIGEKMTFLERVLLLEELLHLNKYYFECLVILRVKLSILWQKSSTAVFNTFTAAIFVPLEGAQTWHLHTKLYQFG